MGFLFDKITEQREKEIKEDISKFGEYSLDSDKDDIKELKRLIKNNEECFLIVSGTALNNNWKIAITNLRIILIRKKLFSNEIDKKDIYLKDILRLDSKKGKMLSEVKIISKYEEILITNLGTVYLNMFLETIHNNIKSSNNEVIECKVEPKVSKKQEEKQYQKDRIKELEREHIPYCPKCKSTSLTYQNKKLSVGRAVVGGAIMGPVGAAVGGLTSKKGYVKCLNCGHKWKL